MTVPKMAGNRPPSVFDSRGLSQSNSPTLAQIVPALGQEAHGVGVVEAHDVGQGDGRFLSRRIGHNDDVPAHVGEPLLLLAHQPIRLLLDVLARRLEFRDLAVQVRLLGLSVRPRSRRQPIPAVTQPTQFATGLMKLIAQCE